MNALALAHRFLRWRAVATWLAVLSIALAVGMVAALRSVPLAIGAGAVEPAVRFPILLGHGESAMNVVLRVAFLDPPAPASLPRTVLERVRAADGVASALPLRIQHAGRGPIVSTDRAYFRLGAGRLALAEGRYFEDGERGVVVVGSQLAAEGSLRTGAVLERSGLRATVVGVLNPTGTPVDAAAFTPLDAAEPSLSAVVLLPGERFDPEAVARLAAEPGVLVVPVAAALRKLVGLVAAVERILGWIAWALAALASALVFSSLYSGARERTRDLAVLRVIGARRSTLTTVILCEAAIVGGMGGSLGILVAGGLLAAATEALSSAGFAFAPALGTDVIRVAASGALLAVAAGLAVGANVYRIDPARALEGVHRPWREVLGPRGRARLRSWRLAATALVIAFVPAANFVPTPSSRLPDLSSMRLFRLLQRWDGDEPVPPEIAALDRQRIDLEGYPYEPLTRGDRSGWNARFFLVAKDPNRPVELFHDDDHRPGVNELVWVELDRAVEATRYPMHVTGTFLVSSGRNAGGKSLYRIVDAEARVIALETD